MTGRKAILFTALCGLLVFGRIVPSYAELFEEPGQTITAEDAKMSAEAEELSASLSEAEDPDLLEGYLEEEAGIVSAADAKAETNKLEGINLLCYERLIEEIRKIADGLGDSTVFEIAPEELGVTESEWTAEELGVESVITVSEDEVVRPDPAAVAAVNRKIGADSADVALINGTLLQNAPYELYWYDKTEGLQLTLPGKAAFFTDGEWKLRLTGNYVFRFAVSERYSAGEYLVDTEITGGIQSAIIRAREVAEENAALPDAQKLLAYRAFICDQVSFDQETAADDQIPYGDPWQIISVFDGDPDTNVVCEGYAKAFKLLCDLSEFESDLIGCITVSGGLYSSQTGQPEDHMWNVVSMDDDRNYLVDVTNCDSGMRGANYKLFLVGAADQEWSPDGGYDISLGSGSMRYVYEDRTLALFTEDELTLAAENYFPPADYTAVYEALAEVPEDLSIYTETTARKLEEAVRAVDWTKTVLEQADADAMAEKIRTAVAALKIPVSRVLLDTKSLKIAKWATGTLKASVLPENASNTGVKWSSSDTAVVTVNSKGSFRGRSVGTAVITAETKDGGYKASCKITVVRPVKKVKINKTSVTVRIGKTVQLNAAVSPSDATNQKVTWTSDDPAVVRVNSKGLIRGLKAGKAKIIVTSKDGGFTAVCTVTVKKN